jgi:hypothetical protein
VSLREQIERPHRRRIERDEGGRIIGITERLELVSPDSEDVEESA